MIIRYGPTVGGVIVEDTCNTSEARKWTGTVKDKEVVVYGEREGFVVSDLNQEEAEALATRRCARAQKVKGGTWDWEITDD